MGLLGLKELLKTHPQVVNEYRQLLVFCLKEKDWTLKHRSLAIILDLVHSGNLQSISKLLFEQLEKPDESSSETSTSSSAEANIELIEFEKRFGRTVISRLLEICCNERYSILSDFTWFSNFLFSLITRPKLIHYLDYDLAVSISNIFMDIALRVPDIIRTLGKIMKQILVDALSGNAHQALMESDAKHVLFSFGWLIGELSRSSFFSQDECFEILFSMLNYPDSIRVPPRVLAVFVSAATKLYISLLKIILQNSAVIGSDGSSWSSDISKLNSFVLRALEKLGKSVGHEVQERVTRPSCLVLIKSF